VGAEALLEFVNILNELRVFRFSGHCLWRCVGCWNWVCVPLGLGFLWCLKMLDLLSRMRHVQTPSLYKSKAALTR
jgi:hypothetical protein